ncbi:hypothetical protein A3J43_03990 [Candidatus Uhrbacteria bacterium RIFCSPHIGHO2_12_FULL_54_23]|uniref:Uncharacterized protein n=1 Tax=Candidatus Uhrbacteria bacterium RIFCSPHIGHO2_12_FULL_54_23 TaxID=1802397 RepID=A0A1F7UH17_9BACT|nr:MAG: hypothetical protein A3J43_03990 [Candidatus Uhrbacteria bacterium RIFCSPHIGHO2_12_FULL_54_23]
MSAQRLAPSQRTDIVSAYRQYQDVAVSAIGVPTVVEIPFAEALLDRAQFAVYDQAANMFEPSYVRQETVAAGAPVRAAADTLGGYAGRMTDGDARTYAEFALPEGIQGRTTLTLTTSYPATFSGLTLLLDNHVALPTSGGIRAVVDGVERVVVAERRMDSTTIRFPRTESASWTVSLTYAQPLRITELRLIEENLTHARAYHLRFLARPGRTYRVYFDPDRNVNPPAWARRETSR